jgi:hypothetical protein
MFACKLHDGRQLRCAAQHLQKEDNDLHIHAGTAVVQADLCNLSNESRTREVVLYTAIVFSIAVIFVALRLTGKIIAKRITPDDYILIAAMLLTAVPVGCVFASKSIHTFCISSCG